MRVSHGLSQILKPFETQQVIYCQTMMLTCQETCFSNIIFRYYVSSYVENEIILTIEDVIACEYMYVSQIF